MSNLLDRLQDMVAFKHDDMSVAKEAIDHIETQAARIAELEAALSAAAEDIGAWGSQASQYSQEKWDLEGDVKRYIAIAEGKLPYRARHPMETWKDE